MSIKDDPQNETIEHVRFKTVTLGSKRARRLLVRLAKSLGPALAVALERAPSLAAFAATGGGLAEAVARLCASLDPDDIDAAFAECEDCVQFSRDGSKWPYLNAANQEELFRGRTLFSFKILAWFLRAQFADFFEALTSPPVGADPQAATQGS